jgi:adenylosuccinate lyase
VFNLISRYSNSEINEIFAAAERLKRFDKVEIAAAYAEEKIGGILEGMAEQLEKALKANPPDEVRRKEIEKTTDHDLMAYVMQRWEILAAELQKIFHKGKTSFDIQDPADQLALLAAIEVVEKRTIGFMEVLRNQALKYWYVLLLLRTHGQGAHVGSFGKRLASYLADLEIALDFLRYAKKMARFGKMSGIAGDYQNATPEIEELALEQIGLRPYYSATQILPRAIHAILASSITVLCGTLAKMAEDFQLMARSPNPLIQEPFKGGQTGSSANPAKKNTIKAENTTGMFRLSLGDLVALLQDLITKEERDIAQSSVERVALIDMFHIALNALNSMIYIIGGMVVYRDHMMKEIEEIRGTEWAESAKEFLAEHGLKVGMTRDTAYAIVKQASHQVFYPWDLPTQYLRVTIPNDPKKAAVDYLKYSLREVEESDNIRNIIVQARLVIVPTINVDETTIEQWNESLRRLFSVTEIRIAWMEIFNVERIFDNQEILRQKLLEGRMNQF